VVCCPLLRNPIAEAGYDVFASSRADNGGPATATGYAPMQWLTADTRCANVHAARGVPPEPARRRPARPVGFSGSSTGAGAGPGRRGTVSASSLRHRCVFACNTTLCVHAESGSAFYNHRHRIQGAACRSGYTGCRASRPCEAHSARRRIYACSSTGAGSAAAGTTTAC